MSVNEVNNARQEHMNQTRKLQKNQTTGIEAAATDVVLDKATNLTGTNKINLLPRNSCLGMSQIRCFFFFFDAVNTKVDFWYHYHFSRKTSTTLCKPSPSIATLTSLVRLASSLPKPLRTLRLPVPGQLQSLSLFCLTICYAIPFGISQPLICE